jgi:hypothetical protein
VVILLGLWLLFLVVVCAGLGNNIVALSREVIDQGANERRFGVGLPLQGRWLAYAVGLPIRCVGEALRWVPGPLILMTILAAH